MVIALCAFIAVIAGIIIGDVDVAEFRRPLSDKAAWYGARALVASRWAPSSKTCSGCGWVGADLTLADRTVDCQHPSWRLVMDRDLTAALNVAPLAGSSSERRNACGEESAGQGVAALVELSLLKQEPDAFTASA